MHISNILSYCVVIYGQNFHRFEIYHGTSSSCLTNLPYYLYIISIMCV